MKYKEWLIIWLNNYMDDSLADIKTTVRQSFLYDEEKGLTIQDAQMVFGNKF